MSDMQRYTVAPDELMEHVPVSMYPHLREVVLASDAEAAITAAEQRGLDAAWAKGLREGQRDMLARCIAAVEAETYMEDALAALRGLGGSDAL